MRLSCGWFVVEGLDVYRCLSPRATVYTELACLRSHARANTA